MKFLEMKRSQRVTGSEMIPQQAMDKYAEAVAALASSLGIDLRDVSGTGLHGIITLKDVKDAKAASDARTAL